MILGTGVDTVSLSRFESKLAETPRLKDRLFLDIETVNDGAEASVQTLAGRFAAKEAVAKALGAPAGLSWQDCEILIGERGKPYLELTGTVAAEAKPGDVIITLGAGDVSSIGPLIIEELHKHYDPAS